jgi:hypothetical protein
MGNRLSINYFYLLVNKIGKCLFYFYRKVTLPFSFHNYSAQLVVKHTQNVSNIISDLSKFLYIHDTFQYPQNV